MWLISTVRSTARHAVRVGVLPVTARAFASSAENSSLVLVEKINNYAIVRLNRPPVNSLNVELIQALEQTIKTLEDDVAVRGVILTSTSPTVFSAGLDLNELYQPQEARLKTFWTSLQGLFLRLYVSPLATVAAVNGHSPAAACMLATCCDYRIMANGKGLIGMTEAQLGLPPPTWYCDAFINTVGHRTAERMIGLGKQLDANAAKGVGLVDEAVEADEVLHRAKVWMERWLAMPENSRVCIKRNLRQNVVDRLAKNREGDYKVFRDFTQTDKTQKALRIYLDVLKKKKK